MNFLGTKKLHIFCLLFTLQVEKEGEYVFAIPLITLPKRLLKSQTTGGRISKFSHSLFGTCEGCEPHAHSL